MQLGAATRAAHFPALEGVYTNTAAQGVPPAGATGALARETAAWSAGTADFERWETDAQRCRELVAGLLAMPATGVALLPSHVTAASTVAWRYPEATVALPAEEYRANLLPWLVSRDPARVRLVGAPATTERLCAAVDAGADLVAVSSVQSATGLRVDLPRLVAHAHERGALVYVDASQSLGVDATLAGCGADFVGAVGYKWLLSVRGTAYLAVRPEHQTLAPLLAGPESARDGEHYGTDYQPWPDARRFDQPLAWLAWAASVPALQLLAGWETDALDRHATALAGRFRAGLTERGVPVADQDVPSPIVRATLPDPEAVAARLAERGVRAAVRAGGLRFAFHLYNDDTDVDTVLDTIGDAGRRPEPSGAAGGSPDGTGTTTPHEGK